MTLNRCEACWLAFLGSFGISKVTPVKGRVLVLGDALLRNPHILRTRGLLVSNISFHTFQLVLPENFRQNYVTDQQLAPLLKAVEEELSTD